MTDNDIRINQEEIDPNAGVKWREPTAAENVQFALTDAPRSGESDQSKAQKADLLGRVYADLMEKAQRGIDKNMSDEDARAEACYFSAAMTGVEDVYGNIWKKNGFKTGREYLAYMHDFFKRSPEENKTQKLREFEAMDDAGREAAAMEAQKTTDFLKHIGGEAVVRAMDFFNRSGNDAGLTRAEESEAPEDVRNASTMLAARGHLFKEHADEEYAAATKTVRDWREAQYRKRVTAAYHADLMAENAWLELSSILPRLSEDGRECTKALMESPDNRLPETMYAKFNNLPDEEKQMLIRARNVLKPKVDGGFWNTIGDMGIGAANIAASLIAAPMRFGNKIFAKGMLDWIPGVDSEFFDINEISRRRQYLWQATGDFFAGGEDGFVPQLQFEQICEDHGFVAEALIGAVTTLPYMAAAAVPVVGVAEVALEAMNEMDDHVAMNGGDITDTDYIFSSAIFGAMYAYTERLQVEGLLGGVSDLKLRQAMLKGFWNGMKDVEAPRQMLVGTVSESLQEGLQNGIQAVNEALALKQDSVRAFGEGFTEDFIGSLGTMFVVEAGGMLGGHLKRSGLHNPFTAEGRMAMRQERSTDLESEYKKYLCQQRMVDYEGQSQELKTALQSMEESRLFQIWKTGGKDALIEAGIDAVRAEEFDYYYRSERANIEAEEETGEAAPMDARSEAAEKSMYAYVASEAKKAFAAMGDVDDNLAAFDLAMQNLDWVRSAWAQGRGIFRQDGDKTLDPGAKALEKLGFTPDVAARLSKQFHYERAAAYSPAALAGIKSRYEERMKDKVTAVAALAEMFGGRKVRIENADYIQFDGKDGTRNLVRIDESPAAGIDFANADEGIAVDVERATEGKVTKADWMVATEDERRKIWSDYGLVHEGSFGANRAPILVTVSADPSAKVDQNQAAKLIGTISIDATTDPNRISDTSSGFHEVFHAFSYFAQASGLWTDEDIAYLEKTFGKAKHSQERFDEEAAAEAFRSFLARRAAGAMTADDERSPFVRIYAAAAGIDQRSAEKAVQEKMANESENAFFHQLIAEANKPKPPAPEPKPTLSKSAAPQKGIAPVKENAAPVKQNGPEVKQNAAPAKQNGPEVKENAAPANADAPKTWSAYTPTGNVKVSGHWAVLDLNDVIHSNNPLYAVHMRAQLRNRKDNKAEEDTRKDIVNNFQGERLLEAPDTANGAPIVFYDRDDQGVLRPFVLSGNGRVLVLNELADRHLYDRYRNVMKKWAAENGIVVPNGQTPILVRVIDDYGGASRDKVADLSNTNSIQQYTEEEQARADAEVIKSLNIARLYVANVDGSADMTPGVNDEFFSEFIRGVGDTSLYNSDRSLTQTARDRAQRALLAIAVGQGDRGRDVVKKLVEQTETLNIQRQKNAAAIIAAQVAALETNAAYAIGPDVSRAMADFMDYAEKKKAGKVGNFAEYYAQMDLIDAPSPVARAILQLFGSDKSAATIAEYVRAYCKAASMEDPSGGLFGAARTREDIWNDAAKFVDEELKKAGQTKTEPAPKAVETKPAPAKTSGLAKGEVSLTPEPEAPKPKLATTGYTITTAKGETITAQLPPGGHTGLRGPYDAYEDVPESPNPIRSIFSGKVTIQKDPQGRYWGDKMPQFMGHKTEMFDRTVQTLREKMTPQELANYDTVVDYFGGGGCWGMSLALATMPNVKRIIINEFDPARASKIELLQTIGEKIADEAEKMLMEDGVLDEITAKMKTKGDDGGESGSGATLANLIIREYKSRYAGDKRKLGLLYAITDCASRQLAGSRDVRQPDGTTAKVKISFVERWKKVKEQLANDGKNASEMRKEIEKRGGTVEYVNGNSTLDDFGTGFKTPHGGNVMAVCDPPYYRTEGYSDDGSSWKVGLEKTAGGYAYADTAELMQRLVDNGDGIVYTDEAWWLKPEYLTTHNVESDGLFDNADLISSQREYRTEHGILQGIRNTLDHFDVAGRVAGRYETLGVHHGNDEKARTGAGSNTTAGAELGSKPDGSGSADNGRHSVRRLAGRAEGEDSTLLRNGRGSGQRSEDLVREVNAAIIDALPDGTYGFPGQLATLERIIRHSVRSVREDKQTAYAKTVAKNAKAYLARTAKQLDARMKAAGYTEKVWHGTGSGQFQVFRLSTRDEGVNSVRAGKKIDNTIRMAFFSYFEGTAENYAAISSFDINTDYETLVQGAKPDVREYYVNPGKCLEIDEKKFPNSYEEWTKLLRKAWKDGYDSVKCINALDDVGMRLKKNKNGEYSAAWLDHDKDVGPKGTPLNVAEFNYETDILVVFDHGEKNPGANRIKAADPITFWDEEHGELPIPLEMRANPNVPDLRHSVTAAGRYYGTRMRELAHGIKTGEKNAIAESARILADYVHDNAVLVPMPSHTGKATTMKTLAEAIAKIRPDVEVIDALKSDPHESNYTHKQRLHKPVAVTMHPTGAKIPDGRPVMVLDNVLASGTTARAALAVIPDADILVLGDASRVADPNEKLSPENEKLRHSIIIGENGKARKNPARYTRLLTAIEMLEEHESELTEQAIREKRKLDIAEFYDDNTRDKIYIQTGWWRGVDGKWRVEIPNVKPKPRFGKTIAYPESLGGGYSMINGLAKLIWKDGEERMYASLKDMVTAPLMFDAYPQLKDIDVVLLDPDSDEMEGINGFYDGQAIGISWDCVQWRNDEPSNILNEQGVQTLTHEIQHIVQSIEGFAYGGNEKDYGPKNYARLAGEVEARNASRRNTNFKMYGGFARLASTSADADIRTWAVEKGNAPWQTEDVPKTNQIITYGDGKMTDINGKPVMRHSIRTVTPADDAAYMDAVKRGDMVTAARMVREAAKKAMPYTKAVGTDGFPLIVYRGEATNQNKFFFGYREDNGQLQRNWFSSNEEVANMFGNTQGHGYFLDIRNPAEYDAKGHRYDNLNYKGETVSNGVVDALYSDNPNSDGVVLRNIIETDEHNIVGDDWLVKDSLNDAPNRIKLADPVTYDDAGNIVPLSKRFNIKNPDIRYSIRATDVEQDARRAITAVLQDGDKKEAEDALENYVAYFKLAHGPLPRPRTIARIGLSLGMNVVDPKRILKNADKLAERMRGTAIETAAGNGDVGTAIAMMKREKDLDKRIESILAGGVSLGSQLTHKGVGKINALTQKRVERMMNDFTAATLADMEGDTGINLAAEILENNPDAFETEYRKAKKLTEEQEAETADQQQEGSAQGAAPDEIDEEEMSDSDRYKRQVMMKEAAERVAKFIEDAKARAKDNTAKAEERRKQRRVVELGGDTNEEGGAEAEGSSSGNGKFNPKPEDVKAGFKTPEEFAAFLRVWTADKFAKTHGLTTIGQAQQNKLFAEYYRICARQELQDLADKLLAPKMLNAAGELVTNARVAKLGNGARVWVNRRLQEMEKGIKPDRIERMSADIFAFINKAAVRVSRVDLIANFKKDLKERFLHDPDFDEFKQDTERKVTGWVEEATRYICRVCDLSRISVNGDPSQLEQEYRRLHEIIDRRAQVYDESGREVAAAAQEDAETLKAQWMLALLDKYGAMRSMMPGEILDLQNAAFQYLEDEAAKLEQAWKDTRAQQDQIRRDFTAAIVGPNGQKYQAKGIFSGRLFDALNGMIRLRLQHLTRFASPDEQAKAKNAINSILVMLGDGETAYAKALQEDREAFFSGLGQIFRKPDGTADNAAIKKYLERLDEPIPRELSEKVSNQGYVGTMTHGQLLQLLVSLEQRSFKDAIKANGREGQAELIRNFRYLKEDGTAENVVTAEDSRFIEMLRAFYAAKRDQLSAVTERMVGHKVDSPDPLYCPVRRWIDDKARSLHTDPSQRWDPISKIFSRRVESDRDFDESRTIIGLFFENSKESAKLTAWAERGSFIRNIVTSVGFQASVKRAFGNGELGKILKQLEATFNGGEVRSQTPGEVAAADKAVNFVTYAYLGFNPLSALKQTTSPFVWANVLDGGFADLWRHMTHFDKNVLKHIMESDEYKVRYGNKVGSGMDYATKGLNMNPSENPAMRFLTGAGMWMLKRGDFIPGGWIAQGVYKDMLNKHMNEGMDYEAADRLAITETFNLLEETQQSGRTYNTNMLQIEHGRIGRLLTQFATSPLQQLQYETQAWREWRDMVRYQMDEKKIAAARQRFWRAAVINHVLMPAAMNFVIAAYKAAMGEEPPWEKDGYHWSLLIDVLMGQFSRVFFLGAFAQTTLNAVFKRETPRAGQILPIEGALGMATTIGFTVHDMATLNYDNIQKDLERMLKSTAPTRIPFNLYRRITGDSDADRKAKKKAK